MTEIKPRIDDDGVPWCDAECPQAKRHPDLDAGKIHCSMDARLSPRYSFPACPPECCPHAVRRMAVELEAWRNHSLEHAVIDHGDHLRNEFRLSFGQLDIMYYDTLDAAVDALMNEADASVSPADLEEE